MIYLYDEFLNDIPSRVHLITAIPYVFRTYQRSLDIPNLQVGEGLPTLAARIHFLKVNFDNSSFLRHGSLINLRWYIS